ncbi:MAG: sulfite exporter TauE/SafE family protein [Pseudomonadota bacterium]|jgi:uncharacterized membrane protein YfcA
MNIDPGTLALILLTGLGAGFAGGLLGIGGGIIIVPTLFSLAPLFGWPAASAMHLAVGTSLATIIVTAAVSAAGHGRRGAIDHGLLKRWIPTLLLGVVLASLAAGPLKSTVLSGLFSVIAFAVALNMARTAPLAVAAHLPARWIQHGLALAIGLLSTLMGIGGGTLSVPVLTAYGMPIHRAVGSAAALGVAIAVVGAAGFVFAGLAAAQPLPPGALGFVYLPAALLIVPGAMLAAPWGVRLAHALDARRLRRVFALALMAIAGRMMWAALA